MTFEVTLLLALDAVSIALVSLRHKFPPARS